MKKILVSLFALMLFVAMQANAQNHGTMGSDTLTVSSAVDTQYLYVATPTLSKARKLSGYNELNIFFRLDSISGSTGGTITIEYSNSDSPTETGVEWFAPPSGSSVFTYMNSSTAVTAASTSAVSWTANGTSSRLSWSDPDFSATYARVRFVVPSSSQVDRLRGWYGLR